MEMMGALVSLLVGLAIPAAIIAILVRALGQARAEEAEPADPGIGTVRRIFLYGLALVSLGLAGSGLALLLGGLIDALFGDLVIAESDTQLAVSLSLTVVGLPAWLIFTLLAQRSIERHPVEARSLARWTYLLIVRAVALGVSIGFGIAVGRFLVGAGEFHGDQWGWLIVALATWAGHQAMAAQHPPASEATRFLDRLYRGFGAVVGLCVLGVGLAMAVTEPAMQVYEDAFRDRLVRGDAWHEVLRWGLVQAAVGGLAWWWHWLAGLRREVESTIWHVVVFLFGILAGLALAVTTSAFILYTVLAWVLGVPGLPVAAAHFQDVVPATGFLLVGLASWGYHRAVLDERAPAEVGRRSDPERLYRYLVAAAGLLALAGGLASAFAMFVDAVLPEEFLRGADWWRDQLAVTLTLLAVGAPLWTRYWFGAQRAAEEGGREEREALPRRAFLFVIFGAAVLVVLVNLAILLFQVFDSALDGTFSTDTIRDVRWSVALLLTAGATSAYYWFVLRDDQAATPDEPSAAAPAPSPTMALGEAVLVAASDTAGALEAALRGRGVRVRRWDRTDIAGVALEPQALDALLLRLESLEARSAVVVVEADGSVRVLPAVAGGTS